MDLSHLTASITASSIAFVITNPHQPDNPIVAANQAFLDLTGYTESEIVGRNCRFLQGPGTDWAVTARVREEVAAGRHIIAEIRNYRKDGSSFRNAMVIAPMLDDAGQLAFFLGSQFEAALAERQVQARARVACLPPRQREVLRELAMGYRNKQIAQRLDIAEPTVKLHRARALERLGVSSTVEATRLAVEAGLAE